MSDLTETKREDRGSTHPTTVQKQRGDQPFSCPRLAYGDRGFLPLRLKGVSGATRHLTLASFVLRLTTKPT